jgi:hypothetical protein
MKSYFGPACVFAKPIVTLGTIVRIVPGNIFEYKGVKYEVISGETGLLINANNVTDRDIRALCDCNIIRKSKQKMTMKQIEEALGYPIEIIE